MSDILIETYNYIFRKNTEKGGHLFRIARLILILLAMVSLVAWVIDYCNLYGILETELSSIPSILADRLYSRGGNSGHHYFEIEIFEFMSDIQNMFIMIYCIIIIDLLEHIVFIILGKKNAAFHRSIEKGMIAVDVLTGIIRELALSFYGSFLLLNSIKLVIGMLFDKVSYVPFEYKLYLICVIIIMVLVEFSLNLWDIRNAYKESYRYWQWSGYFDRNNEKICYYDLVIFNNQLYITDKVIIKDSGLEEWIIKKQKQEDDPHDYPTMPLSDCANDITIYNKYSKRAPKDKVSTDYVIEINKHDSKSISDSTNIMDSSEVVIKKEHKKVSEPPAKINTSPKRGGPKKKGNSTRCKR